MTLPAGLKDWRTTVPTLLAVFFGFVLFKPQHFPEIIQDVALFAALGGAGAVGIQVSSAATTKRKTAEQTHEIVDAKLNDTAGADDPRS
jgi:hypothetical protein